MILFRELHKAFDGVPVLRGVNLTVREGQTFVLLGPSGTGKSVLIKHAVGLLEPDLGDVEVDGISIARATRSQLRHVRGKIGYVFQNAALFDSLTVLQNLALAVDDEHVRASGAGWRKEAAELLSRVNLGSGVLEKYPSELSGGMRKRVGIARAIAHSPRYVLYDEPTTGLDPVNAETIDELIAGLSRDLGVTSIVVTHDLDSAFKVGDRIALLMDGRIRACGTPAEFRASNDPAVQKFIRRGGTGHAAPARTTEIQEWRTVSAT